MAADLVMNPRITQTEEHDLESVFWILLWMCLSYMKTTMPPGLRADILNNTMSPRVHDGSGGMGKANFMASSIALGDLTTPNCPMADLLKDLHGLLSKRYRPQPKQDSSSASPAPDRMQSEAEHTVEGATVDAARRDKVKHEEVLAMLEGFIGKEGWPDNDLAMTQERVVSKEDARTGSRRSRSCAELHGNAETEPAAKRLATA
jgi:hypothetical protein